MPWCAAFRPMASSPSPARGRLRSFPTWRSIPAAAFTADQGSRTVQLLVAEGTAPLLAIAAVRAGPLVAVSVSNAARALPTGGRVTVTVEPPAGLTVDSLPAPAGHAPLSPAGGRVRSRPARPIAALLSGTATPGAPRQLTARFTASGGGSPPSRALHTINYAAPNALQPAAPQTLQITTSSVPNAAQYQPYQTQLFATGGVPPYSWSVDAGANISLPEGIKASILPAASSALRRSSDRVATW